MIPRRTLPEWVTVAKIAPQVGHLFVEGASDANLMTSLMGYDPHIDIRPADQIDVDTSDGDAFLGGNKLRVWKLGAAAAKSEINNVRCLIDADFDSLYAITDHPGCVCLTDFANLPCYVINESWMRSFLLRAYGAVLSGELWVQFVETLLFAFCSRYISAVERQGSAPDISEFVKSTRQNMTFDRVGYVTRYFSVNKMVSGSWIEKISDCRGILHDDPRHSINSNDLFSLTFIFLRRARFISGAYPREAVRSAMLGATGLEPDSGPTLLELVNWKDRITRLDSLRT